MKLPYVLMWRAKYDAILKESDDANVRLVRENCRLVSDLSVARHEIAEWAHTIIRTQEKVNTAQALAAEKQREIGTLRTQLAEKEQALQAAYTKLREDSQKVMDWMAKGMSHGVPIFAELPPLTETEPAKPEPKPGTERIPTPVEQAIQSVGRKARAIVNHISHRNDTDFADAMAGQGVKRKFQEDKIDAEIEAELIAEQSKTA